MAQQIHDRAGLLACNFPLANIPHIVAMYYESAIDVNDPKYQIAFGTSGHRGSSLDGTYTQEHIKAITQAIVDLRKSFGHTGPLFLAYDTHALSDCAFKTALEVLCANNVETCVAIDFEYTPTPVISREIVRHNLSHKDKLADGIIITPSHNPPQDGGFKYNPPHGGPAGPEYTKKIEERANEIFKAHNQAVKQIPYAKAINSDCLHFLPMRHNFVQELATALNMQAIAQSSKNLRFSVNPQGGSSLKYWEEISDFYKINLDITNHSIDPTFQFMPYDYDGNIRMDCMSPYTMRPLIESKSFFDFAIANDPDADRHGVVTSKGLLNSNHYLCAMMHYLLSKRNWPKTQVKVGKTIGASMMMDKIIQSFGYEVFETPIGFKWFAQGLFEQKLVFGCEESAGASFLDLKGLPFTTDKDGFLAGLIGAEIMACTEQTLDDYYANLEQQYGKHYYGRADVLITKEQKEAFKNLTSASITTNTLAQSKIIEVMTLAKGNQASIGGVKVLTEDCFFSARPSGTENLYKIYYESCQSKQHAEQVFKEASEIVNKATGL